MPRRPALVTQADIARVIRAAKQNGATEIELRIGEQVVTIRLVPSVPTVPVAPAEDFAL